MYQKVAAAVATSSAQLGETSGVGHRLAMDRDRDRRRRRDRPREDERRSAGSSVSLSSSSMAIKLWKCYQSRVTSGVCVCLSEYAAPGRSDQPLNTKQVTVDDESQVAVEVTIRLAL